jgi:hypothetical protein
MVDMAMRSGKPKSMKSMDNSVKKRNLTQILQNLPLELDMMDITMALLAQGMVKSLTTVAEV